MNWRIVPLAVVTWAGAAGESANHWAAAAERARIHAECGELARRLLAGWLDLKQDPTTRLYSRGKTWDYHNEGADHYSSLVLIAHYVDPRLNEVGGALRETLISMLRLCSHPSGLLTTYDLVGQSPSRIANFPELAEWLRDGLLRINELLGTETPWYRETLRLVDAMLAEGERRGGLS